MQHSEFQTKTRLGVRSTLIRMCLFAVLLFNSPALADQVSELSSKLKTAEDFRVRTQAALALGATGEKRAVVALCQALNDSNRVVRIAVGTAISRLQLGGKGCLRRRIQIEKDAKVKSALARALAKLDGGGAPAEPLLGKDSRFYLAIAKLPGADGRDGAFRAHMIKGLRRRGDVGMAPAGETASQAKAAIAKFPGVKGFKLSPRIAQPKYEGGMLKIKITIAMFRYPDSSLIGEFSQTVAMGGISGPDTSAEAELINAGAEAAMQKFLTVMATL